MIKTQFYLAQLKQAVDEKSKNCFGFLIGFQTQGLGMRWNRYSDLLGFGSNPFRFLVRFPEH